MLKKMKLVVAMGVMVAAGVGSIAIAEPASSSYYYGAYVGESSTSYRNISAIQGRLIQLGYSVGVHGVTGVMTPTTHRAVKSFQRDAGLKVDGIVGPHTAAALNRRYSATYHAPTYRYDYRLVPTTYMHQPAPTRKYYVPVKYNY